MHALLQGIDLRELLELAHNVEDDALSENGGQPQTLSSIYYFLFSKTGTVGYLHNAIDKGYQAAAATPLVHL
jgi:hypothetical protein